ncbi:MAG: retroviral-like aspartic protease family protein [Flavobacteriaceae bacterium]|nr:retroviral-like aspartic protease family protein [Flavobacteriaceae bacterium]
MKLKNILKRKNYITLKLKKTITGHYEIKAKINGKKGRFILDTGASNSCVGLDQAKHFKLNAKDSKTKASGAGAIDMPTQQATKNKIKLGKWSYNNFNLILFDLSHVNTALTQHNAKVVHGVIGADILQKGNAIIDYQKDKLYLKKIIFKF